MPEPTAPPLERILGRPEQGPRSIVDLALHRDPDRVPSVEAVAPPSHGAEITRRVTSLPITCPRTDWEQIVVGSKRMFRTYSANQRNRFARIVPEGEELPRPVLIHSRIPGATRRHDFRLAVLTDYRQEPLGAISPADVISEGFDTLNKFRRYWKTKRYPNWGWRPGDLISVIELRPWEEQDDEEQGAWLLRRLYGDWA